MVLFNLLFLLLINGEAEPSWQIRGTDIYRTLTPNQVSYGGDEGWFVLDVKEQRLLHYSVEGRFLKTLTKKGEGPEELQQTDAVYYEEGNLYAVSPHLIKIFDTSGRLKRQIKRLNRTLRLKKIKNGWIEYPNPLHSQLKDTVVLYNNDLTNPIVLSEWETKAIKRGGKRTLAYRPDIFCMALDAVRNRLYLRKPNTNSIEAWDLTARKLIAVLPLNIKIDAETQLKWMMEGKKKGGRVSLEMNSWYADMRLDPYGNLYFYPNRSIDKAVVFDAKGTLSKQSYKRETLDRLLATQNNQAFLSWREVESGEVRIARVPLTNIKAFVAKYPIKE